MPRSVLYRFVEDKIVLRRAPTLLTSHCDIKQAVNPFALNENFFFLLHQPVDIRSELGVHFLDKLLNLVFSLNCIKTRNLSIIFHIKEARRKLRVGDFNFLMRILRFRLCVSLAF